MVKFFPVICTLMGILCAFPAAAHADKLRVFVAASLTEAVSSALVDWPEPWAVSAGGSGAIARQVAQGAPADVVMLANPVWMDWLANRGHLIADTRAAPIGNRLILVGPSGAQPLKTIDTASLLSRLGDNGRIAMGERRSVPAGQYAKTWLETAGLWDALNTQLAEVENVRAALTLVSRSEVPLALVYASDLVASPDAAHVVWSIPDAEQPRIAYALAAITQQGRDLAAYLAGPDAAKTFARFGFVVLEQ